MDEAFPYTEGVQEAMRDFDVLLQQRDGARPGNAPVDRAPPSPPPDIVSDALAAAAGAAGVPHELRSPSLPVGEDTPAVLLTARVTGVPLDVAQDVLVGIALDRNRSGGEDADSVVAAALRADASTLFTPIERKGFQDRALKVLVKKVSPKCKELQAAVKASGVPLIPMLAAVKCLLSHPEMRARPNLSHAELIDMGECMHEYLIRVVLTWTRSEERGEAFAAPEFK